MANGCTIHLMIRQIRGLLLSSSTANAVIEVGGFGIVVYLVSPLSSKVGEEVTLATYLAIKQDGLELYGFTDADDRDFFELLLTVSGIGPKTALSVLRRSSRDVLRNAIGARDLSYLTKIVGLGKKSAEKMIVELADKVGAGVHEDADGEIFDTLVALGYTEREARGALQTIPKHIVGKDARLKAALSHRSA